MTVIFFTSEKERKNKRNRVTERNRVVFSNKEIERNEWIQVNRWVKNAKQEGGFYTCQEPLYFNPTTIPKTRSSILELWWWYSGPWFSWKIAISNTFLPFFPFFFYWVLFKKTTFQFPSSPTPVSMLPPILWTLYSIFYIFNLLLEVHRLILIH